MDRFASLYEISKRLLSEDESEKTAEILLRRVVEATNAERGFIVVRGGDSYVQKFDVDFDRKRVSKQQRRFSRSLVQQALQSREPIDSPNLRSDPRFVEAESVRELGDCSVLAAPLNHGGQTQGAVYLERR